MRTAAIALCALAATVAADEPNVDTLIDRTKAAYETMLADCKSIKDRATAETARPRLDRSADNRDQIMQQIAGLKLKPVERDAAQLRLNQALAPTSLALQAEVARIALSPDALAMVETHAIVREMAGLLEQRAYASIRSLELALRTAALRDSGVFPKKLDDVSRYLADKTIIRDPWGREWHYDPAGKRNTRMLPDVWTVSPFGGGKKVIGNVDEGK
jgi:hypothetical protein